MLLQNNISIMMIGAHPDDIELGCAGFTRMALHRLNANVDWLILSQEPGLASRRLRESNMAAKVLGGFDILIKNKTFEHRTLHQYPHELMREIEKEIAIKNYDLILTHSPDDMHPDHRAAHEATITAARRCNVDIWGYETPSTKQNKFNPVVNVYIGEDGREAKLKSLKEHVSQKDRQIMKDHIRFLKSNLEPVERFEIYKCSWR